MFKAVGNVVQHNTMPKIAPRRAKAKRASRRVARIPAKANLAKMRGRKEKAKTSTRARARTMAAMMAKVEKARRARSSSRSTQWQIRGWGNCSQPMQRLRWKPTTESEALQQWCQRLLHRFQRALVLRVQGLWFHLSPSLFAISRRA